MSDNKPPAFQFYAADFKGDTKVKLMSNAARGVYIMLLCCAWDDGSIPADVAALARIVDEPVQVMKKLWPSVAVCFEPMPGNPMRLVQPRMERERAKQREYHERRVESGKASARKRWAAEGEPSPPDGSFTADPVTNRNSSSPSSTSSSSNTTTASTPADARGQADDEPLAPDEIDLPPSPLDAVPISVLDFGRWFTQQGVENGAVDGHHILDGGLDFARRYGGLEAAGKLIAAYGLDECKTRSLRLFAAVRDGKNQRNPSISTLSSVWSKPDIAGTPAAAAAPKLHPSSQRLLDTVAAIRRSQSA